MIQINYVNLKKKCIFNVFDALKNDETPTFYQFYQFLFCMITKAVWYSCR